VAKVDLVPENVRVNQLPDILLAIIGTQTAFGKLGADFRHFEMNDPVLLLLVLGVAHVANEQGETTDHHAVALVDVEVVEVNVLVDAILQVFKLLHVKIVFRL